MHGQEKLGTAQLGGGKGIAEKRCNKRNTKVNRINKRRSIGKTALSLKLK